MLDATARNPPLSPSGSMYSSTTLGAQTETCFTVSLYVDDIAATTPAAVVWRFRKGAHVRLSDLAPLFKANRGFYGELNCACTVHHRPYYAINVVQFKRRDRIKDALEPSSQLTFRIFYDDSGVVRSRFDLTIVVQHDHGNNIHALGVMCLRLKGASLVLAHRDLGAEGSRSRTLPALMFTPQVFRSITRPEMPCFAGPVSRKLSSQAWARLSELNAGDWERYTLAKGRFTTDYSRQMRANLGAGTRSHNGHR